MAWFRKQPEIAVLSQVNHVFVVKHNKQFKQIRNARRIYYAACLVF
ncbi:hypothetical protein [Vibrio vulnificus YJ016]|uniref:Uncharacterized protein n=1 Tax=Vibrio vulnificus (strain YJ016) TaxID=196600 RepID=Q7MKJ4_VIBVY|nr:hypothetical protein [Vibrio vulnificus YJ016]